MPSAPPWLLLPLCAPTALAEPDGPVEVIGVARDAKITAVLVAEDGSVFRMAELESWPEELEGQVVRVRGRLSQESLLPEATRDADGAWSQGVMPGSGPELVLRQATFSLIERAPGEPPAPWSLSYRDGSGNITRIWRETAGADPRWAYHPVQPLQSSSGSYSGGEPGLGKLDPATVLTLWERILAAEGGPAADPGQMGTGLLRIEAPGGARELGLAGCPTLSSMETFLASLRGP